LPRLRPLSGEAVCEILERHGFKRVRQRGSHVIMQAHAPDGTTTVPVPNHRELRVGTLQSIIRQSGVPRSEFEFSD
jgi:predicted RNA binding protein YcfA (HicA-like mRNA interferase family)